MSHGLLLLLMSVICEFDIIYFQHLLAHKFNVSKLGQCLNSPFCFCVIDLSGHVIINGIYISIF